MPKYDDGIQLTGKGTLKGVELKENGGTTANSYLSNDNKENWRLTRGGDNTKGITIDKDGQIGVGSDYPNAQVRIQANKNAISDVNATAQIEAENYHLLLNSSADTPKQGTGLAFGNNSLDTVNQVGAAIIYERTGDYQKGKLHFYTKTDITNQTAPKRVMTIDDEGNLQVTGDIKIKDNWKISVPDYVFEEDYKLRELHDISDYVRKQNHLPDIPSREEIQQKGLNLNEMSLLLLKKVEELTLYLIEQNNTIEKQQKKIESLELKLNAHCIEPKSSKVSI